MVQAWMLRLQEYFLGELMLLLSKKIINHNQLITELSAGADPFGLSK